MTTVLANFKKITDLLLHPDTTYLEIRNACISLSGFFYKISGFDITQKEVTEDITISSGQAISPYMAALCINDMMRTRVFLQGIESAISDRLKKNPGHPVVVLYAGTGPFATLLSPLITRFSPQQLQMVLLEVNPTSFNFLEKVITGLEMQEYVMDLVQADASVYQIPSKYQPDILLCEAMKTGLQKEPQVKITSSLLSQCTRNPILVPQVITVSAGLLRNQNNSTARYINLSTLLELDYKQALMIAQQPGLIPVLNQGISITIPEQNNSPLALFTTIVVYKNHKIGINECGLTLPRKVKDVNGEKLVGAVKFIYEMGELPGFRVTNQ